MQHRCQLNVIGYYVENKEQYNFSSRLQYNNLLLIFKW